MSGSSTCGYLHVESDASGRSRSRWRTVAVHAQPFAPPAPPLEVSEAFPAVAFRLLRLPPGWEGDWHPTPVRQWLLFLSGRATMECGDGTSHPIGPGSIVLLEDVSGKGHRTSVHGADAVVIASVQAG